MKTCLITRSYLVTLWAVLFVSCGPTVARSVAVFDFELIDTSLEGAIRGARPDERVRLARLARVARMESCGPILATHFLLEKQVSGAHRFIRSRTRSPLV